MLMYHKEYGLINHLFIIVQCSTGKSCISLCKNKPSGFYQNCKNCTVCIKVKDYRSFKIQI